ncbi:MAG: hypothetical protein KF874_09660 [Rhizobiaceae bacterium]|nr:hypothetical protein [Rhizobiaceae bacterium]
MNNKEADQLIVRHSRNQLANSTASQNSGQSSLAVRGGSSDISHVELDSSDMIEYGFRQRSAPSVQVSFHDSSDWSVRLDEPASWDENEDFTHQLSDIVKFKSEFYNGVMDEFTYPIWPLVRGYTTSHYIVPVPPLGEEPPQVVSNQATSDIYLSFASDPDAIQFWDPALSFASNEYLDTTVSRDSWDDVVQGWVNGSYQFVAEQSSHEPGFLSASKTSSVSVKTSVLRSLSNGSIVPANEGPFGGTGIQIGGTTEFDVDRVYGHQDSSASSPSASSGQKAYLLKQEGNPDGIDTRLDMSIPQFRGQNPPIMQYGSASRRRQAPQFEQFHTADRGGLTDMFNQFH